MRRRKDGERQISRGYDFLGEVDPVRLQLIGAISLVWNWIEGAVDATLAISLEVHPDMWVEVASRINGMDGKLALLRRSLSLVGYPPLPEEADLALRKFLNAVAEYKRLRDGIIHARLIDPRAVVADTLQRKGQTDEVLISVEALSCLYAHLSLLGREADQAVAAYFFRWKLSEEAAPLARKELIERLVGTMGELYNHQKAREALPAIPNFPPPPPAPHA